MSGITVASMADQLESAMLGWFTGSATLDEVKVFFQGDPGPFVDQHLFPFGSIYVESQSPGVMETGMFNYVYTGLIAYEAQIPTEWNPVKDQRIVAVPSYVGVRKYLDASTNLIESHLNVDGVVYVGETALAIELGSKDYYIAIRDDGFTNRGEFRFTIQTQKPRP